jgi:uncharacterized membrane protein YsdA (DUF1294 family)
VACGVVWGWLAALSLVAFTLGVLDKRQARTGGRRQPEKRLLLMAGLGGWPGLLLAMLLARHKVRKVRFLAPFLGLVLANALVFLLVLSWFGCPGPLVS